jgi:hypothetical protein
VLTTTRLRLRDLLAARPGEECLAVLFSDTLGFEDPADIVARNWRRSSRKKIADLRS